MSADRHLTAVDDHATRELPHDLDAEQVVIGAAISDRDALDTVTAIMRDAADLYRPAHQVILAAAQAVADRGSDLSPITVNDELVKRGETAATGGGVYLAECASRVPSFANAGHYAAIVAEKASLRRLVEGGTRIAQIGYAGVGELDDLLDAARRTADAATEPPTTQEAPMALADRMADYIDRLAAGRNQDNLVPVPYDTLRRLIPGWAPGQLISIGARPGMGKSVFAVDILRKVCIEAQMPGILFSLEMTADEVMDRVMSAESGTNLGKFSKGTLNEYDWQRISDAQARVANAPMIIDDSSSVGLGHIRSRLRHMARTTPARIAIVDYLQLMQMPAADTREQSIAAVTRELKLMAREFSIPIVVLAQLNRGVEGRNDKLPTLADFRESGAIEQDSNVCVMLHRPEVHDPETSRAGELDLNVAKNRSGPVGVETVQAQMHYARCVDFDDPRALGGAR